MSFDADEEILQDFLVEAGEILELLSEQLVELENRPEDKELLNAIFRGFHTVKGGAGFLQLDALVACCHIAENVFDILRKGERPVTSDLMDVVLQALDAVNVMFDQVRNQQDPTPAEPALLDALAALAQPASADVVAEPSPAPVAEPESTPPSVAAVESIASGEGDITDDEFELLLDALHGDTPAASPAVAAPPAAVSTGSDEISDDEFDALLDELHGQGGAPTGAAAKAAASNGDDISDDEFESLLDELHGKGAAPGKEEQSSSGAAKAPAASGPADPDKITDDEFESLLDQLHGHGAAPGKQDAAEQAPVTSTPKAAATPSKPEPKPAAKAATPAPAASAAKTAPAVEAPASTAETTVRVDTARLDEIMNMVGELVLVRNRLVRLGLSSGDEELNKAVGNLDVVTADLQMSVMKTRMQPIKKVFGRFPRVVRDLARSLKKEINLELIGEETDLDKNLVEALADPLVHLVRNSVDHGVELPAEREAVGKPR
ncbi:MAG: Hpt domain-containing protein, partial [Pseudomonas neustonica]